eukprot:2442282-Prymnesium_polylepis.1
MRAYRHCMRHTQCNHTDTIATIGTSSVLSRGNVCLVHSHSGARVSRAGEGNRQELKRAVMHPRTIAP